MKTHITCLVILFFLRLIEGAFRCDYKYSEVAKAWFKHFVVPAVWSDARLRCTLEGGTLVSPTTPELQAEMSNILEKFFPNQSEIFTGIHATFSQGDYFSIEGISLLHISAPWAENEPDNVNNTESCITFNNNGDLADRNCMDPRPYVCYRQHTEGLEVNDCGNFDPDYNLDTRTGSCYKFHTVPRTFSRANLACSAEGGHLVIINSETEATVVKELFAKYPAGTMVGNFWKDIAFVGFSNWGEYGDWRTIQGQTLLEAGYDKFSGGEPNNSTGGEYCGAVYRSGLLNDAWCNRVAAFICEKIPNYPAVCKATSQS